MDAVGFRGKISLRYQAQSFHARYGEERCDEVPILKPMQPDLNVAPNEPDPQIRSGVQKLGPASGGGCANARSRGQHGKR